MADSIPTNAPELLSGLTFDEAPFAKAAIDDNGFLRVTATVTAPGVYSYMRDGVLRRELKPADEVYSPRHMDSIHGAVVTDEHPSGAIPVMPVNSGALKKGHSRSAPVRTSDGLSVELVITDPDLIAAAMGRKKTGVSLGMRNDFEMTPGVWTADDGSMHPYDVVQRNMVTNHIAIVAMPRVAGAKLHLDSQDKRDHHMDKSIITIDGADFEVDKTVASIVKAHLARRDKELVAVKAELATATATCDSLTAEVAKVSAERDKAQGERDAVQDKLKTADSVDINKLVEQRLAFTSRAKSVLSAEQFAKVKDKPEIEVMRFTCDSCDVNVEGKPDAYVHARFDALVDAQLNSNDDAFRSASLGARSLDGDAHIAELNSKLKEIYTTKKAG